MSRFIVGAVAAAWLVTTPATAKVAESSADGFVTQDVIEVSASPLESWLALIQPGKWWADGHTWSGESANMTITPQAGGCFCERVPGEDRPDGFSLDGSVLHMTVIQAYPLKVLRMRGGLGPLQGEPATGVLTVTIEELEGGSRIRMEYAVGGRMRYEIPKISKLVDTVMTQQLHGLRDYLGPLGDAAAQSADPPSEPEAGDVEVGTQIDALEATEEPKF